MPQGDDSPECGDRFRGDDRTNKAAPRHIGLFTYGLTSGGVARRMVTLANALAERGDRVALLLVRADNVADIMIDDRVKVIGLAGSLRNLP